jgi:hypothetical protein
MSGERRQAEPRASQPGKAKIGLVQQKSRYKTVKFSTTSIAFIDNEVSATDCR